METADTIITLCDEQLHLHHERCIYWPTTRTLIVADVHLGKEAVFQRSGMGLPSGIAESDIARLDRLTQRYSPERLLVLGDLVHALPASSEQWIDKLSQWLNSVRGLTVSVVQGNHDKPGVAAVLDSRIQWQDALLEPPFYFNHEPARSENGYAMGGHLHPVVSLTGIGSERLRLPVFWLQHNQAVLPAFGSFVGGHAVKPARRDEVYAAGPDGVVRLQ